MMEINAITARVGARSLARTGPPPHDCRAYQTTPLWGTQRDERNQTTPHQTLA